MKDDWIYEREKENRYRTSAGGENEGIVASGDVFEAETTSRYLKT